MPAPADDTDFWLAVGLCGNAVFGTRFLVQWVTSERAGRSVVPPVFWYLSIGGSLIMLSYAIHIALEVSVKKAVPLILSYAFNTVPYVRNLMLIAKERRASAGEPGAAAPSDAG